ADRQPRHRDEPRDHGRLHAPPSGAGRDDRARDARAGRRDVRRAADHVPRRPDRLRHAHGRRAGGELPMTVLWMTVLTALRALRRNKLRSALTMLGIIIGVAAVVTMVSIGRGADAAVQQQIRSLGNNLLMVVPGATTANGVRSGWGAVSTLTVADAAAIRKDCPTVADLTYVKRSIVQVIYGNK